MLDDILGEQADTVVCEFETAPRVQPELTEPEVIPKNSTRAT